jgi:hypothetical protein
MSYVSNDIVYFLRLLSNLRLHTISYAWHTMSYVSSCGLFRRRKQPGALPLALVNMSAAFPVIFAFFPASQSAGQHETRACALIDAQKLPEWPWSHGSTKSCMWFKLCGPPLEARASKSETDKGPPDTKYPAKKKGNQMCTIITSYTISYTISLVMLLSGILVIACRIYRIGIRNRKSSDIVHDVVYDIVYDVILLYRI